MVPPPWNPIYFLVEINRSVRKLCRLTQTPHLKVFVKVSEPATFASDRLLIRVLLDNIVFTAIHDNAHEDAPQLDISIWVDKDFAHLEVKKEQSDISIGNKQEDVLEQFFRSFVYEKKYNFGAAQVVKVLETLRGKVEWQSNTSELLLLLHIPNYADFDKAASSHISNYYPSHSSTKSTL